MNFANDTSSILVTCPVKSEVWLAAELAELGYENSTQVRGGVEIEGCLDDCIFLNFHLRTAYKVLFLIKDFKAPDKDVFLNEVKKIRWEDVLKTDEPLTVTSHTIHPDINNTFYTNLLCKDGIADRMKEKKDVRLNTGKEEEGAIIYVYWKDLFASVYIDTTGVSLAKHGYRKIAYVAPMAENLGAACILATHWDRKSHFINPMCGSGTLAIEAALIATNRANGLLRSDYAFMHILGYYDTVYHSVRKKAKESVIRKLPFQIIATDISNEAVDNSYNNAQTAGVDTLIDFEVCDVSDTKVPEGNGIVMMNLPYGFRVGEISDLEGLYKKTGDFLKQKCKGKNGYLFTGNLDLAKLIGLKAKRRIEFLNAKIDCRLLEYELYEGSKREPKVIEKEV